ncbi:MAG: Fe-S cluster domain-containing protein [Clostridia bacterium]|nr:Fe-S cluster domain-containing protein [Clostridia bacterium]MBQ3076760.1 Fe-S cluster domain-containing protein [Clostridia bacterium]
MNWSNILMAVLSLTSMGVIFGVILGVASRIFAVETDPRAEQIIAVLPSANCGGCGYAGCANFAEAVVSGDAPTNGCAVGGSAVAKLVAEIMGQEAKEVIPMKAVVKCSADCDTAKRKYTYEGFDTCRAVSTIAGGEKACSFACCGHGDCVKVCRFGAIQVIDGLAVVDRDKCTGCGTCARTCPKGIIQLRPAQCDHDVLCSSHKRGVEVRDVCKRGCVACGVCVRNCHNNAIRLENNLAVIDPELCINCHACVDSCPRHTIRGFL